MFLGEHIVLDEESKARLEKARLDRAQFFEEEEKAAKEPTPPKTPTPSPPRTPTPPPKSPTPPPPQKSPTPPPPAKTPPQVATADDAAASLAAARAVIEEGETRLKQTYEQQISSLEQNVEKHKKSFDELVASRFSEVS